jgi:hypothetical protein
MPSSERNLQLYLKWKKQSKKESYPYNRPWRPIGFLKIPNFVDNWLIDGGGVFRHQDNAAGKIRPIEEIRRINVTIFHMLCVYIRLQMC